MKIIFVIDPDRISKVITTDEYLGLRSGDLESQVEVMSKFVKDNDSDKILPYKEGRKIVGQIPIGEIGEYANTFLVQLTEALSSKKNAGS